MAPLAQSDLRAQALRMRLAFQAALLKWFRDEGATEHLDRLTSVLDRLRAVSHGSEPRRVWWVGGGVIEAVRDGGLEPSVAVKLLFGGVDREIKRFAESGEATFASTPPRDLVKNLLYYIAHSTGQGPRARDVRATYRLDTLLPTQKELQHAQGSMTGHNRNLLDTVSVAIKEDLLRVKESLDIFLRSSDANPADLSNQAEILDRVGDTLGMLGLGMPRKVVSEQRTVIEEMADHRRPIDEGALLDVAGALLYVEASLDDHIERLGAGGEAEQPMDGELELPKAEVRKILDALMREAAVNIQQAKHDIIAFIESPWEHARVEQIPRLLEEISGALRMLGLSDAAQLMTGIVRFVETELLQHRRVPTAEQMDKLADALAAIEYYLEATREQRGNREKILDVTRESLEALGYWPVPSGDDGPGSGAALPPPTPSHDVLPPMPAPEPLAADAAALAAAAALAYSTETSHATPSLGAERDLKSLRFDPPPEQFPSWGDHLPSGRSAGLRDDSDERASGDDLPSVDLPDLDIELGASEWNGETAETRASNDAPSEFTSAVEIVPGQDIGDLIVGEAIEPERSAHDLAGLRFAETNEIEPGWTEIEEEIEEEVPVEHAHDAGFHTMSSEDIDDEIREVFVEEVQEEIENMQRNLPLWKADVENLDALKPIRRSFHTLKGSGRLVGAMTLGEFSWKVENMLNRVLDRTVAPSHAVVSLVDHAVEALPELLAALRGGPAPTANVHGIMTTADRVANGEDAHVPVRAATRKIRRVVRRRVPIAAPQTPAPAEAIDIESAFAAPPPEVHAGPAANIDPVLFDILKSEVAQHLGVIGDYLDRSTPMPVVASETLLRAVHTLNGAIAMVDIAPLGHVLAPLEGYIKRLRGIGAAPGADGIAALEDTVSLARDVVQRLDMGIGELPDSSGLVHRVIALRDALPEPETSLHLYSGPDLEEAEAPVAVAEEETHFSAVDDELALADDDIERHHTTPAVAMDDDLTGSLIRALDAQDAEAAPFAEVPAEMASSLADFDLEHPAPPEVEAPPVVAQDDTVEPSFGSSATLVDAALLAAFEDAEAEQEAPSAFSEITDPVLSTEKMVAPVEDEADVYVPDDEVPAVAFEADDVDDFSEIEPIADSDDIEPIELAEVETPIEEIIAAPIAQSAEPAPVANK
ncbi:MAG TPA: Hpt domain-containing protein, partial [Rhodanobacteraceae bacterium]|nr:Hpt domain-containing protein [Rhodanobacteraceae bacterium]